MGMLHTCKAASHVRLAPPAWGTRLQHAARASCMRTPFTQREKGTSSAPSVRARLCMQPTRKRGARTFCRPPWMPRTHLADCLGAAELAPGLGHKVQGTPKVHLWVLGALCQLRAMHTSMCLVLMQAPFGRSAEAFAELGLCVLSRCVPCVLSQGVLWALSQCACLEHWASDACTAPVCAPGALGQWRLHCASVCAWSTGPVTHALRQCVRLEHWAGDACTAPSSGACMSERMPAGEWRKHGQCRRLSEPLSDACMCKDEGFDCRSLRRSFTLFMIPVRHTALRALRRALRDARSLHAMLHMWDARHTMAWLAAHWAILFINEHGAATAQKHDATCGARAMRTAHWRGRCGSTSAQCAACAPQLQGLQASWMGFACMQACCDKRRATGTKSDVSWAAGRVRKETALRELRSWASHAKKSGYSIHRKAYVSCIEKWMQGSCPPGPYALRVMTPFGSSLPAVPWWHPDHAAPHTWRTPAAQEQGAHLTHTCSTRTGHTHLAYTCRTRIGYP